MEANEVKSEGTTQYSKAETEYRGMLAEMGLDHETQDRLLAELRADAVATFNAQRARLLGRLASDTTQE